MVRPGHAKRGGGGGGRNRGGRGGGGGWGHNRGNQNWNSMQKGGGAKKAPWRRRGPQWTQQEAQKF